MCAECWEPAESVSQETALSATESVGREPATVSPQGLRWRRAYRLVPMHREKASLGVRRARLGNEYDDHDPPDLSSRDFSMTRCAARQTA